MIENKNDYPDYQVTFDGDLVVVQGSPITEPIQVRGSHSFTLPEMGADVDVKVVLAPDQNHDPGVPHLKITIKRAPTPRAR